MDYKKKYEEAERLYRTANAEQRYVLESLFPELKESEDERIREYLIRYIDNTMKSSELKSKLLAWLEKQGEQKHAWSNEDERILKGIIGFISHSQHYGVSNLEMLNWLKSIKERIGGKL